MTRQAELAIRSYRPDDREPLADLWVAAWNATLPEIDFAGRRPWICDLLDQYAAMAGAATLCGVAAGGALVGFAMLEPARHHLEQLAVAPGQRGLGVGTRLLDAAKRHSPERLSLAVNQDNPRAVAFYRREGFVIVGADVNPGGRRKIWRMEWRALPV